MSRISNSRATIAAGTNPPRVTATSPSNGPSSKSRQASALEVRCNSSHDTGKALSVWSLMRHVLNLPYVAASLFVHTSRHAGAAPSYETATKYVRPWRGCGGILFHDGRCRGYGEFA